MFNSLLDRIRTSSLGWRGQLFIYWLKDNGGFLAMVALPVVALGLILHFAYADHVRIGVARQREIDLRCLAENIYFEARGEPTAGQFAVAEVTLNRVASRYFPDTICEVVHDIRWDPRRRRFTAHFSWTELKFRFGPRGEAWQQAMSVATAVYDGAYTPQVPRALFYHSTSVNPYWAKTKKRVATIGNHVFYR